MGNNGKKLAGQSRKKKSLVSGVSKSESHFDKYVSFSFKDLNTNQHLKEDFNDWDNEKLLVKLLTKIKEISNQKMSEATKQTITIYGGFPPSHKTEYVVPSCLNEQVQWGTIHIQGKEVIAGYMIENIFSVVFLDKEHKFWISEKKNT